MTISSRHPLYDEMIDDWRQMRDTYRGERHVKQRGVVYLPPTSGMVADGFPQSILNTTRVSGDIPTTTQLSTLSSPGFQAYKAYRTRAVFPDLVSAAIEAMLGVMHNKDATIELPSAMEPMLERATLKNESLQMLLRRINEEQLISGRLGLLLDLPETEQVGVALPYIAMYQAEKITNWDQGRRDGIVLENLNLVVLDESEYERQDDFAWKYVEKYRVLVLGDPSENEPEGTGTYRQGVFRDSAASFSEDGLSEPVIGGTRLDFIPFTFINSKDVVPSPDDPPLLGLSNLTLTIYRGEADYRQSLFMQGQDTLVVSGAVDEDFRVGANATIVLPQGGTAQFIGVESAGLSEQREALQNDYNRAAQRGGEMLDSVSRERESGDALKIRVAARTATLNQIALAGAFGLQESLRHAAMWLGLDPEEVKVKPNLDFVDDEMSGEELVKLVTAKTLGAPLSRVSIHTLMQNRGVTELTLEEELGAISSEEPLFGSVDPNGPEPDEDEDKDEDEDGPQDED